MALDPIYNTVCLVGKPLFRIATSIYSSSTEALAEEVAAPLRPPLAPGVQKARPWTSPSPTADSSCQFAPLLP